MEQGARNASQSATRQEQQHHQQPIHSQSSSAPSRTPSILSQPEVGPKDSRGEKQQQGGKRRESPLANKNKRRLEPQQPHQPSKSSKDSQPLQNKAANQAQQQQRDNQGELKRKPFPQPNCRSSCSASARAAEVGSNASVFVAVVVATSACRIDCRSHRGLNRRKKSATVQSILGTDQSVLQTRSRRVKALVPTRSRDARNRREREGLRRSSRQFSADSSEVVNLVGEFVWYGMRL